MVMKVTRKSLSEQITEIVEDIVKKEENELNLDKKVYNYWIISEEILKNISIVKNKIEYVKNSYGEEFITDFEKDFESKLNDIEYLISSSEDSEINKYQHYSSMQHNYYKIKTAILDCKSLVTSRRMKDIDNKLNTIELKSKSIDEKFEGIGSTILSTIVSLTVVITAISAIEKIPECYIPLYLISIVWLAMTLIVFISNLFNKNDFNNKQAVFMYGVISILEFIIVITTKFKP